jgi:hypothetical protein
MLPSHFMEKTTGNPLGRLFGHNRPRHWIAMGQWAKRCPAQKNASGIQLPFFASAPEQQ